MKTGKLIEAIMHYKYVGIQELANKIGIEETNMATLITGRRNITPALAEKIGDVLDTLQEEPVSDECIYNRTLEERQRSCKFCSAACQVRIKEEPVSEELEKAAKADAMFERPDDTEVGYDLNRYGGFVADAKWKEKQMIAKAIDGDITFDYYGDGDKTYGCIAHDSFCLEDFGLKDRDKVKVIVIKEGLNYE